MALRRENKLLKRVEAKDPKVLAPMDWKERCPLTTRDFLMKKTLAVFGEKGYG